MNGTIYIGLNDNFHDPSICIIDEKGEIVFAEGSERFLQYKRALGCPADLEFRIEEIIEKHINYPVTKAIICYSWEYKSHLKAKIYSIYNHFKSPNNSLFPDVEMSVYRHVASLNQAGAGVIKALKNKFKNIEIEKKYFNHHLSHIANAIDSSCVKTGIGLIIDGKGDDTSYSIYFIDNGNIKLIKKIKSLFSLGYLYGFFTELCGYSQLKGEEWKVMGLSPYGGKNNLLIDFLISNASNSNEKIESKNSIVHVNQIYKFIKDNSVSKEEIAFAGQYLFEKIFFDVITQIKSIFPHHETIFISGGSALNTLAIGKLAESNMFKNVIVPNAPGDDGNAIGSALLGFEDEKNRFPSNLLNYRNPYLGSEIETLIIEKYIQTSGLPFKKMDDVSKYAAQLLHQNKIIGWIQGRAEFGPRSLGNRSILAHPGFTENKDRINKAVKFRESYRPFAPSILHEFGDEYFDYYSFTPYMEKTLTFKESVREKIPAVVHVNGTGRLQSVTKDVNENYYNLISEFYQLTGLPLVVNTSYNVMGKPIVHDINDVMAVFFNSSIDAVFIGDYVLERKDLLK